MDFYTLLRAVQRKLRRRRMRFIYEALRITRETKLLDVGGTVQFWQVLQEEGFELPRLYIANILPPSESEKGLLHAQYIVCDATRLPFSDMSFDVAFSNSVIEHVGGWKEQQMFAREVRRVGRSYCVQTPNKMFPVEPHIYALFIHWFPKEVQKKLIRNFSLWGLIARPDARRVEKTVQRIRLLTRREVTDLFPEAQIFTERVAGLAKSFTAIHVSEHGSGA